MKKLILSAAFLAFAGFTTAQASDSKINHIEITSVQDSVVKTPIKLGNVICIEAKVTRAFTTSMEIHLKVWNQNIIAQTRVLSNEAYFTFVALDDKKQPMKVPEIIAETDEEKKYFASALRRRQLRLILAGKMKPDDATELKALFIKEEVD